MRSLGILFVGLLIGVGLFWMASRYMSPSVSSSESTNTIVTKLEKVFKIITAEGHFNEIYNYKQTKEYFHFIPSTKQAILIINAKVLMGFDFEKLDYKVDNTNKTIRIFKIPAPSILSIEPDYKFYNIEDGLFNKFAPKELNTIENKGKDVIVKAVGNSQLPQLAKKQLVTILHDFFGNDDWQIVFEKDAANYNVYLNE